MAHVLRHLREGGWGKKALQEKVADMTQLRIDETTVTKHEATIASYATQYYNDLFETAQHLQSPAEQEREDRLQALLQRDFLHTNFTGRATAGIAEAALSACPKRKTCAASDGVVTEMRQAALQARKSR